MSEYAYCPRGGINGIRVSDKELDKFSDAINSKALDEVIPLPRLTLEEQKKALKECEEFDEHSDETKYWERDNGSHGWCCSKCGSVVQWG